MWLTLDIGNSAAKGGLFANDRLAHVFHVDLEATETQPDAASAPWREALAPALEGRTVERIGIASVVPTASRRAATALEQLTNVPVQPLSPDMQLPFDLAYRTPETLGIDRLAAAAAAWARYGVAAGGGRRHVVALDAGTAVTLDLVTRRGVYAGGVIGAGPALLRRALSDGTAQLPAVPLEWPARVVGRSTQEALQSGIMGGFVESVRGLLRRITASLDTPPAVVATGGWHRLLAEQIDGIDHTAPHLVLEGIRVLMTLNPIERG